MPSPLSFNSTIGGIDHLNRGQAADISRSPASTIGESRPVLDIAAGIRGPRPGEMPIFAGVNKVFDGIRVLGGSGERGNTLLRNATGDETSVNFDYETANSIFVRP